MATEGNECFLEAAGHIRRGAATDTERSQGEEGESNRQTRLFREWALQEGRLVPIKWLTQLSLVSSQTSEHIVYFDPSSNRAVKQTLPGQFGWIPKLENGRWTLGIAQPLDYLRRWLLFNQAFGDDVRLEGATVSDKLLMIIGGRAEPVTAIISQRWHWAAHKNHPTPTPEEVAAFFEKIGI